MKFIVLSMHSDFGDDALPIGAFDTLDNAKQSAEKRFPTLEWDYDDDRMPIIKLSGKIGTAEYLSIIEVPHNDLLDRDAL